MKAYPNIPDRLLCTDCLGEGEFACGLYPPPECDFCDGTGHRFGPILESIDGQLDDEPVVVRVGIVRELLGIGEES